MPYEVTKISERLTAISSAIGKPSDPLKQFTQPLDFVVEELSLQLDAVQPNTSLASELNFALNVSKKLIYFLNLINFQEHSKQTKDENAQKISEIYEILNRWNSECQALPLILERLRHCGALQEQGLFLRSL